ncbi:MAG TPA: tetratricopeptide repeat protein [Candidatus Omnitrophota bacterium]|nr:tetratricopeptide repeat protein [Candidatus Omnitrophota bacterium]
MKENKIKEICNRCVRMLFTALFVVVYMPAFAQSVPPDRQTVGVSLESVADELDFARKAIKDGFYDTAENKLNEILEKEIVPDEQADAHLLLGRVYYEKSLYAKASAEFRFIVDRFQDTDSMIAAIYWLGEVSFKEKNYRQSVSYFQEVLDSFPGSEYAPYAMLSVAWACDALGEPAGAIEMCRDIIKKYADTDLAVDAQYKIGEILYSDGKYGEAISELKCFIEKYPVNERIFEVCYMLGDSYLETSSYREAADMLARSMKSGADISWKAAAEYKLGIACDKMKDTAESEKWLLKAVDDSSLPELSVDIMTYLAYMYRSGGDLSRYRSMIDEINKKFPGKSDAGRLYVYLGDMYYASGDFTSAVKVYQDALRFGDVAGEAVLRYNLGWALVECGQNDAALTEFLKVPELSDDKEIRAGALCRAARILQDRNENQKAMEIYDRVLKEYPETKNTDYVQYEVGYLLKKMGRLEPAIMTFRSLLINFPDSPYQDRTLYQLGILYNEKGDLTAAVDQFNRVLAEFKSSHILLYALLQKGNVLLQNGRYDDAIKIYDEIMNVRGDRELVAMARYFKAQALYKSGSETAAFEIFQEMLQSKETGQLSDGVKLWFGEYYYGRGQLKEAGTYFLDILKNSPSSLFAADAEYWLGWVLYDMNVIDESIKHFEHITSAFPDSRWDVQSVLAMGDIFAKLGRYSDAVAQYKGLAKRYPDRETGRVANRRIASILKTQGKYDLAGEYFKFAITGEDSETNAAIQYDIAECCELKGNTDAAIAEYLKVGYRYPKGTFWVKRADYKCARILETKGDMQKAYEMYLKLSRGDGDEAAYAREKLKLLNNNVK